MKFWACLCVFTTLTLALPFKVRAQDPADSGNEETTEELAIQKSIASYIDAFNKGDAKAVAAHWNEGGAFETFLR